MTPDSPQPTSEPREPAAAPPRLAPSGTSSHPALPAELPLVVLSGPSGVGKTTIIERLLERSPVRLVESISATTRPPRPGEIDGRSYYFLSRDEFEKRREAGDFLEWAEVHRSGHLYGTLLSELDRAAAIDAWVLLEIDVEGALNVLGLRPEAISIFIHATDPAAGGDPLAEYERRLRVRGTEDEETLARRLQTTRRELDFAARYRYQVVNEDVDRCVEELCRLLADEAERRRENAPTAH